VVVAALRFAGVEYGECSDAAGSGMSVLPDTVPTFARTR